MSYQSRQIDGEKIETVADYIFLDSKITVDSDCSHEIKRYLPGESHRQRSLRGYGPWGHMESDITEETWLTSKISHLPYSWASLIA